MDREILFRGKRTDNGEWVEGGLLQTENWASICVYEHYQGSLNEPPYSDVEEFDVIPETVGEFTGLLDKNGKRIYEGDIVDFFNIRGKIVDECGAFGIAVSPNIDYDLLESKIPFNNNANFCFNDNFISLWELWWNYEQDDNPLYEVEIIGNIHDNPELLEVSE